MANRSGGRQRLLAVYEILREFSDEEVPLTKTQICKLLYEEYNLEAGMPIGVQIIGPALGDQKVLNIGYAFQQMTDFHRKRPGGAQGGIARDMSGTSCGTQEVR